jgi:hypothetical protein
VVCRLQDHDKPGCWSSTSCLQRSSARQTLEPQNNFLPGRSQDGDYRARVVALKVGASQGFKFHLHQLHGNTKRLKPGWCGRYKRKPAAKYLGAGSQFAYFESNNVPAVQPVQLVAANSNQFHVLQWLPHHIPQQPP